MNTKEMNRFDIISDPVKRHTLMQDIMEELSEEILKSSSLYNLITLYRPEIIIDCINSATAIAYQDIYTTYRSVTKSHQK